MATTLWVTALLMLLATTISETSPLNFPTLLESPAAQRGPVTHTTSDSVFKKGPLKPYRWKVEKSHISAPPHPLFFVAPKSKGTYPILFFVHGTFLQNSDYADLFDHIASHGYVVVAPQLWSLLFFPSQYEEIEMAASVLNWLASHLQDVLPPNVEGDLSKLAVSGHSRGGKTAFALALGLLSDTKLLVTISALIGVDPVAGTNKDSRTTPYVLTYVPKSFNLSVPIMIIGTGHGQPCAPNEVNYKEFFDECKAGTLFVVTGAGHMDMLNGFINPFSFSYWASLLCPRGTVDKDSARRTMGGTIVAFLEKWFINKTSDYDNIIAHPSLAPTELVPFERIQGSGDEALYYSQM